MPTKNLVDEEMLKGLQLRSLSDRVERLAHTLNSISVFIQHNELGEDDVVCDKFPFNDDLDEVVAKVNSWALAIEEKRRNLKPAGETDVR